MEFRLLGAVECRVAGEPVPLGRPQSRCLLAVLLLERGRVVPLARLVDLLWEASPPRARAVVQTHVSRLRATLRAAGADRYGVRLVTRGDGYAVEVPDGALDLDQFRQLVEQGRGEPDPSARVAYLRKALALWRGPALADVATGPVRAELCAGLDELLASVHEECAEGELQLGRHRELITELTGLVARYPLRERLVELLMLANYRAGQQAAALAAYRDARRRLVAELGIEPAPELRRLEQAILSQDPSLLPARPGPVPGTLAAPGRWLGPRSSLTSIVGREPELAELAALLADYRLVTVVGVGGVGKTTLALHVAEALAAGPDAPAEVVVLPLAPLRSEEEALLALAATLEVREAGATDLPARIGQRLAEAATLLVLDNCEHVGTVAGLVRRLLSASATLVVLATSREPLGLPEELVWRLDPLAVPHPDTPDTDATPAVSLFLRRAAETVPGFAATGENLAAAARIARRVDGLPLALELAAGRLRTLPVAEIADELEHSFRILATDRHRADPRHIAMTATLDWSYRLLPAIEQRLLPRLSVFRDGFTMEAAAAVCGGAPLTPAQVRAALPALTGRSLLQSSGQRYRLLEVVRADAAARLAGSGEADTVAGRHLDHWLRHARQIVDRTPAADQVAGMQTLRPELDNLRAAVDHAYTTDRVVDAVELTTLLSDSWMMDSSRGVELERWLARAEPHLPGCPARLRGLVRLDRGLLRTGADDCRAAAPLLDDAVPDLAGIAPFDAIARITAARCAVRLLQPQGLPRAREVFADLANRSDSYPVVHGVAMLAEAMVEWGHYREAVELCRRYATEAAAAEANATVLFLTMRCAAQLGTADHAAATQTAAALRRAMALPGNFVLPAQPARVLARLALLTMPPDEARARIAGLDRNLDSERSGDAAPGYLVQVLQAEADRRAGHPAAGVATLRRALAVALTRSNYAGSLPGVVGAALLAADLGDRAAASALAGGWERVRRRLGLPAPLGYEVGSLGLSPEPSGPSGPSGDDPSVAELLRQAHDWAASAPPSTRHHPYASC